MPRRKLARLSFAVIAAVAFVGCSDQSPVAPGTTPDGVQPLTALAPGAPGSYELTFFVNGGGELILTAHVQALTSGELADGGAVIFQYCSYKGVPRFDITQPDEAPISACEDGSGKWITLIRVTIDPASGDASFDFGTVSVVNIIGFRGSYISENSNIASGDILPVNWTR
jgi:hypothetical protein